MSQKRAPPKGQNRRTAQQRCEARGPLAELGARPLELVVEVAQPEAGAGKDEEAAQPDAAAMTAPETVYELKLKGRGKVTVQLSPMGVVVTEKKKPPTTHLYQTLTSWGKTPRGFEIQPAGGRPLDFTSTAEEAETICDGMTEKAVSLAKAAKEQRKAEKKAKEIARLSRHLAIAKNLGIKNNNLDKPDHADINNSIKFQQKN